MEIDGSFRAFSLGYEWNDDKEDLMYCKRVDEEDQDLLEDA
jgi:hypothetical protein